MNSITAPQRKKIYAMSHQLRWSTEILHRFLKAKFVKEHISALTRFEAFKFINILQKILDDDHHQDNLLQNAHLTACTNKQCKEILNLAEEIGWTNGKIKDYIEQWGAKRIESLTQFLAEELIKKLNSELRTRRATSSHKETRC